MATTEIARPETDSQASRLTSIRNWNQIILVGSGAIAVIVLIGWFLFASSVKTNDAQVDGHITTISPRVSGNVVNLWVDDNREVHEGDPLVEIDPRDYQAAYDQAKAAYDVALAEAQSAKVNISLTRDTTLSSTEGSVDARLVSQADLVRSQTVYQQSATASLEAAKANLEAKRATNVRAQADLKRYRPLLATGDVSQYQFDAIEATARVAESEYLAAQQQVLGAQESVEIAKAQTTAAQHQLRR